jgi:hypothetical protein
MRWGGGRVLALGTAFVVGAWGRPAAAERFVPAVASYRIEATLKPAEREVEGTALLRWQNRTAAPAKELYFHLYLNAFANSRTTLMAGMPEAAKRWQKRFPGEWGGLDVRAIRLGAADVTARLEFVQPDDGNPDDRTVARLPLEQPVRPGETRDVAIEFTARLPRVLLRAGHADPFFMVAQWFPKLGVFEHGRWNCHQYHATTEFYADFGTYEVALTVPSDFVVGHTGVAESERDNGDGTKTVRVRAEDVHDFAWAADPRFVTIEERIGGTAVRALVQPAHRAQAQRYLAPLRVAMARYAQWLGPYPYPTLTIIDPPAGATGAGGMEYPTLITTGTRWWMPAAVRWPEAVTVHEFGHQYWFGMLASNEFEAAWLDEGINSYVEGRLMDELFGPASYLDAFGLRLDATAKHRLGYLTAARHDPVERAAYAMLDRTSYRAVTYAKTALVLQTLEQYLGRDRWQKALGEYARAWRFRHPRAADWRAAIEAAAGEPLDGFFAQTLEGTGVLDYAITRVDARKVPALRGRGVPAGDPAAGAVEPRRYRTEVVVERLGEVQMPVDIVITFEDGSTAREVWDGRERWRRFEIVSTQRADHAVVDPDEKLSLDINRLNNSRMRSGGTRGIVRLAVRWGLWLQNALQFATGF